MASPLRYFSRLSVVARGNEVDMTTQIIFKGNIIPHETFCERYEEFLLHEDSPALPQNVKSAVNNLRLFLASMEGKKEQEDTSI